MTPSAEQREFATSLHDLLAAAGTPAIARAWARGEHEPGLALWRKLGKLGVTALAVPEAHGGMGAGRLDVIVAFEELGHHAVPGPLIETIVVAPTRPHAGVWLERIAAGEALASIGPSFLDADVADLVLGGAPGPLTVGVDRTRRLHPVAGEAELPDPAVLACAAQLLGLGQALLEMSVAYAKQRVQFGQPIGRYQAIKHKLSDVYIALEFARPLLYHAIEARDVSAAKVACGDAAYLAARTALQVHGAIGYTEEYDLGIFFTKVRALLTAWGTPAEHRARVMAAL
jgi:alkylation response protein AidB-like acyl-CoA dehydrogenase